MFIRRAKLEDAFSIAKVHVESWRTTYQGIIPSNFLEQLKYESWQKNWENNILREDNVVYVVENDTGEIIGFADTSKRESNNDINSIDLTSIYLLKEYQGKGVGKMLMKKLFEHYKRNGYKRVYVDVLTDNQTKYFYEYLGAKYLKDTQIKIGGKVLKESFYIWESVDEVLNKLYK